MRGRWLIAALVIAISGAVPGVEAIWAQQGAATPNGGAATPNGGAATPNGVPATTNGATISISGGDAKPQPPKVGSYSLVITTLEPTAATHWLNPPPTIDVTAGTKLAPAVTKGNLTGRRNTRLRPLTYCARNARRPRRNNTVATHWTGRI